ncbi:MAG TPA: FecR domain-containing protein [Bryobacteraceae bacterium]|nr:FecR domain-containing protein [Bryobacteraceae bacterium]
MKNVSQLLTEIRAQEPTVAEIDQAAGRVRQRLFQTAQASDSASAAIRDCSGFTAIMPASLAGSLDAGRQLLLDAHVRECRSCRRAMDTLRHGASRVVVMPAPARSRVNYTVFAAAAAVVLVAGLGAYWAVYEFPALQGGPRATVEQIQGVLYRVNGGSLVPLASGAQLGENDAVRTAKNSTAVLRLNDGSKVEVNQRAQIYVTRGWTGSTVHLALGSIIVAATKQRRGSLQVVTSDCDVSVKGTVFSVDAGTRGSRVAVAEGTVWVDHGQKHDVLHRGDQTTTVADMAPAPLADQFSWSPNSSHYMALLGDLASVSRQINAIPAQGLRYNSNLLSHLPANTIAVAAIPNIGSTLSEGITIFHNKLAEKGALSDWWNSLNPHQRDELEKTIQQITTASQYLGNEIVIYATGFKTTPVIVAEETRPGLDTYLQSQLPADFYAHVHFENNLVEISDQPVSMAGGFTSTALYQKMAPEYQQGAGWVFAADATAIAPQMPSVTGLQDVHFLIATSRTSGNQPTDNHASVIFSKDRTGVASWLAQPGPMGSLSFVSPDAGLAVSALLKNPKSIVDDVLNRMLSGASESLTVSDLASAFGGEVTIALDGPVMPVPSWKLIAEVYDPSRIQAAFTRAAEQYNTHTDNVEPTGQLRLTQSDADNATYYTLKFDKLPWEADWTYVDGYWVVAASHELVARSIQNRQTGYTLPRSDTFQAQLSRDRNADFSAIVYHNLGQTLAPIAGLLGGLNLSSGQQKAVEALKTGDKAGLISFWAAPDRIDVATRGTVFGMDFSSLFAMQTGGFATMLQSTRGIVPVPQKR